MSKKLQKDSKYAMADADGDGVVTDEEMDRHAMWVRLENEDKQADTQRLMAWVAMSVSIVTVIILLTPIINITRMESASGFLNTFLVAQMGVVLGFMGATALSKTKMKQESGMATYVNDLRLTEIATGDETGDWGDITNTNLELVAEAFSFGTEAITTNADTHTTTIADGGTDPGRSLFLKYTGTLDSACTITIAPNTVSKLWFIENGTSGSQNIIISQGSGANITIPPGDTKAIYSDGAGSGAAMVDAFASLSVVDLKVQDDLTVTDDLIVNGDIDLEGSIDVNGTANLDVVDIDGAVDMASTLTVSGEITANGGIALGDNDKATFGVSDDLQIFHDGGNSVISDVGDGNLYIGGANSVAFTNQAIDEFMVKADQNGAVTLYYDNAAKIATTSTGIDVTGAISIDNTTNSPNQTLMLLQADMGTNDRNMQIKSPATDSASAPFRFTTGNSFAFEIDSTTDALVIAADANVGIGLADPSDKLTVSAGSGDGIFLEDDSNSGSSPFIKARGKRSDGNGSQSFGGKLLLDGHRTDAAVASGKSLGTVAFGGNHTNGTDPNILYSASISGEAEGTFSNATTMPTALVFYTGSTGRADNTANVTTGSEAMRIKSDGKIGIGTSSPDTLMELVGANPILTIRDTETGVSANDARLRLAESGASSSLDNYFDLMYNADKFRISSNSVANAFAIDRATGAATFNSSVTATSLDISGGVAIKNGATSAGFVEFFEDSDNGTNKVTLIGPASTADVTLTLPASAGTIATTASAADDATALAIALG